MGSEKAINNLYNPVTNEDGVALEIDPINDSVQSKNSANNTLANEIESLRQSNQALIQQLNKQSNIINQQASKIIELETKERELAFELYQREQEISKTITSKDSNLKKDNNLIKSGNFNYSSASKFKFANESFLDKVKTLLTKIFSKN